MLTPFRGWAAARLTRLPSMFYAPSEGGRLFLSPCRELILLSCIFQLVLLSGQHPLGWMGECRHDFLFLHSSWAQTLRHSILRRRSNSSCPLLSNSFCVLIPAGIISTFTVSGGQLSAKFEAALRQTQCSYLFRAEDTSHSAEWACSLQIQDSSQLCSRRVSLTLTHRQHLLNVFMFFFLVCFYWFDCEFF